MGKLLASLKEGKFGMNVQSLKMLMPQATQDLHYLDTLLLYRWIIAAAGVKYGKCYVSYKTDSVPVRKADENMS